MSISHIFGSMVFDRRAMKKYLPRKIYSKLLYCNEHDMPLSLDIADEIAKAMKCWAVKKGATHFSHWFQPMTGITAEKHESFISPAKNGGIIMRLNGKDLIKGEPDASSFPSGGLRSTFEARGYTAWDPTSHAFIKDGILCIPTAFCSYDGNALDKKTPLLRSMEALNKQGVRLLSLLGKNVKRINVEVGAEQEYFLIDAHLVKLRKDLLYTERTLLGTLPPKGQELSDHYFGAITPRVAAFMKELDEELWKLGILAKTKHNETAPAQHEFAPIFTSVNLATDQNQLTMEVMKKVASKHNMACLLHEKPFKGVNGSGKHNNWSISADNCNLFESGNNPRDNAQFLLMLCAVISAVDTHQDLLRTCVATTSNDLRLGANEAPPAIISMFLGDELTGILQAIAEDRTYSHRAKCEVKIGVHVLPKFPMDSSDRNRTSPIAFTGNKFEFRMCGSSQSIADINTVLNTIMAEQFDIFANEIENATSINDSITQIIKHTIKEHGKIIFNGNNYSQQWKNEAARRKLLDLPATPDCISCMTNRLNVGMFEKYGVFSQLELKARQDILTQSYCRHIKTEALTMLDMAKTEIIPAVLEYKRKLCECASESISLNIDADTEITTIENLSKLLKQATDAINVLNLSLDVATSLGESIACATHYKNNTLPAMQKLRDTCDALETHTSKAYWPMPTYGDILFSVY